MPKLLITGNPGFVSRVLAGHATAEHGDRWALATLAEHQDVRNPKLSEQIAPIRADAVIHLAARTSIAEPFRNADRYFAVNFNGTLNLLLALRATDFRGRILYVSRGDCYGAIDVAHLPVNELQPLRPRSSYAVSKVAAEALRSQWSQTEGLDAIIARPFSHIGAGSGRAVRRAVARQAGVQYSRRALAERNNGRGRLATPFDPKVSVAGVMDSSSCPP